MRHDPPPRRRTAIRTLQTLAAASAALLAAAIAVPALADPSTPASPSESASASPSASDSASPSPSASTRASASPSASPSPDYHIRAWFEPPVAQIGQATTVVITMRGLPSKSFADVMPLARRGLGVWGCDASPEPRNSCQESDPDDGGDFFFYCELVAPGGTCRFQVAEFDSSIPQGQVITVPINISVGAWDTRVDASFTIGTPSASPSTSPSAPHPSQSTQPSQPGPTGQSSQPSSSGGLPVTGTSLPLIAGLAAVLLGTGAALLIVARRRRRSMTP